jgi:hypothetical protein
MASKPTEMCVVEKSGAREYKVLLLLLFSFLFFLLRLFLASVSFFHHLIIACCDYSFFSLSLSLSLCRHSIGWLSLSRRRRLEMEGRRSNESRGVVFAPRRVSSSSSSICVVPKVGREETRAALGNDWIDEKKRRRHHSPSKSRAI